MSTDSSIDVGVPKGMRRKDYEAGYAHGRQSAREDYEEELRRLDMLEVYEMHIEQLDHTRKSYRGMLKVQGREIRSLRARLKHKELAVEGILKTNARLASDLVEAWEFMWTVAGYDRSKLQRFPGNLVQHARSLLLKRRSAKDVK